MSVKIRKARPSDHAAIRKMDRVCLPGDPPLEIEDGDLWWVGEDNRPGVGLVCYAGAQEWQGRDGSKVENALYVHRMGVMPSHRGQKLQARMLRVQVAEARRRRYHEVWSYTSHTNNASMNTFIACGFATWMPWSWDGWRNPWKPEGDNGWVYWRKGLRWKGLR